MEFVMTCGIRNLLNEIQRSEVLKRHLSGDWGNVCKQDKKLNDEAILHGGRTLSVYTIDDKNVWVITESDKSVTTILLPDEY